jgi:hypothetical protein
VVLLLLVAFALALHLVAMADHTMMMLEACFGLLALATLLLRLPSAFVRILRWIDGKTLMRPTSLIVARRRYPPIEGTVLLD